MNTPDYFTFDCIGCGYCCRKSPCFLAQREYGTDDWDGCPALEWNGEVWRCGLYEKATSYAQSEIRVSLAIGAGCCSAMNTYRVKGHVPTPEELEDEEALLDTLR